LWFFCFCFFFFLIESLKNPTEQTNLHAPPQFSADVVSDFGMGWNPATFPAPFLLTRGLAGTDQNGCPCSCLEVQRAAVSFPYCRVSVFFLSCLGLVTLTGGSCEAFTQWTQAQVPSLGKACFLRLSGCGSHSLLGLMVAAVRRLLAVRAFRNRTLHTLSAMCPTQISFKDIKYLCQFFLH